nr:cell wall-binding repeat-containing protein [uncultured Peptostreptococcus sp.]
MTIIKRKYIVLARILASSILASLILASFLSDGHALERLSGKDRFSTAAEISRKINPENRTVVMANARSYVDALSGGSLASASKGRILLVEKDIIPGQTMDELTSIRPNRIYILGGYSSISLKVEDDLKARGYEIIRISGQNRYETSENIVEEIKNRYGIDGLCLVSNQMDAISACAYCGGKNPILLIDKSLANNHINLKYGNVNMFAIGGKDSISQDLYDRLGLKYRIAGRDRYDTAIQISRLISGDKLYVASGQNIVDALSLGPLAFEDRAGIILSKKYGVDISYKAYINSKYKDIKLVGGQKWIPEILFNSQVPSDENMRVDTPKAPSNRSSYEYWDYYNHYDKTIIYSQDQIKEINARNIARSKHLYKLEDISGQYGLIAKRTVMRDKPGRMDTSSIQDQGALTGLFPWDEVVIVGYNSDKTWAKVYCLDYYGWIPVNSIMKVSKTEFLSNRIVDFATYINRQKIIGNHIIDMGTKMPIVSEDRSGFKLAMPVAGDTYKTTTISLNKSEAVKSFLPFNQANIIKQALKFEGEKYGWGHSNMTRDCSGFIRDVYRSFGVIIPRDTSQQANDIVGENIDFSQYSSRASKEEFLMRQKPGICMYMKGHVMMYLGKDSKSRPYMIHQYGYAYVNGGKTGVFKNEINDIARLVTSSSAFIDYVRSGRDFTNLYN